MLRASKHLDKKLVSKETDKSTLFEEVNILLRLDHPNIVRLYHLYEDKKNYIMVTEYCSGGELFARI
jgi:calcium-dependent protein kinase